MYKQAEAAVALSIKQGFPFWVAWGISFCGWALAMQGQGEERLAQVRHGIVAWQATGAALTVPYLYTLLAEVCARLGQLTELYEQFQRSECSFSYMAEQLGITTWDLYTLLERRGLRTTNL